MLVVILPINTYAMSGVGTKSNPYLISSASDLNAIHNDLDGYYKLTCDIDMCGVNFTPIGNESEGAFTGTIDGAGYSIKNLNLDLPEEKYVGLIGYLEGTIKNINLVNVNAYGYKYVSGIAGCLEETGVIDSCYVSGSVKGNFFDKKIPFNIGGIVGYNCGTTINSINKSTIIIDAYEEQCIGGIAGKNDGSVINCENRGNILFSSNFSAVSPRIGGVVGNNTYEISNCTNDGVITGGAWSYTGGIVGVNTGNVTRCINNSYVSNTGTYTGGISAIDNGTLTYCWNRGSVYSTGNYVGGIAGTSNILKNCFNSGMVYGNQYASALSGNTSSSNNTLNCINSGYAMNIARGFNPTNSYYLLSIMNYDYYKHVQTLLDKEQFKMSESFKSLDFENIWFVDKNTNSSFPQLQNMPIHIDLNECIEIFDIGDSDRLYAYIDGVDENVVWSCDDTSVATVSENGIVTAKGIGICTVTATNTNGMKANCLIYVYDKADSIEISQRDSTLTVGSSLSLSTMQYPNVKYEPVVWESSDEAVVTVDKYTGNLTAKQSGKATITATTVNSGVSDSCTVTVTGRPATSLSISSSSANINKGDTMQLNVTAYPSDYQGEITWSSSDNSVVTVDKNGLVTAKYPGMAYIYAQAESGVTTQCTVTVKAPAESITLNKSEITLQKGYTEKILTEMLPTYSTDSITWSTSSSTYATVSADGTVTAKNIGQAIITATTTSGQKAYCTVNIVAPTVSVSSVELNKDSLVMTTADIAQLNAKVLPDNATNKNITWTSSNEDVAIVNSTGVVVAVSTGSAIITATANNGYYDECAVTVVAANGPSIVTKSTKASPGQYAEYTVSVVKNPGMSAYKFSLDFDEDLLETIEVVPNSEIGGDFTTNLDNAERSVLNVMWYATEDFIENTDLFTVKFKVSETAQNNTELPVTLSYAAGDVCNSEHENLAFFINNTNVEVCDAIVGDLYEDGEINVHDILLFSRYLAKLDTLTDRQLAAANVFAEDEIVDIKDAIRLAQIIVNAEPTPMKFMRLMSFSSEKPIVTIESVKVNDAGEVLMPVTIKNNSGIAGFNFEIDYNKDEVEILAITPNEELFSTNFQTNVGQDDENALTVAWVQDSGVAVDGTLFTIKAKYKDGFDGTTSPISIKYKENNFSSSAPRNVEVDYVAGYVMKDDYIVEDRVVGDTNFSCELYFDNSYEEQSAAAIIAFYDVDGRLVQLMPKDITVKPGKVDLSIDYDKKAYATYKLMIWEGMNSLKPVTEVK